MPASQANYNLLQLNVDVTIRRLLNNMNSISPRTNPLFFVRGDTLRGEIRVGYETGLTATPIIRIYPLPDSGVQLKLTNGVNIVYAQATGFAYITTATNGLTDGRLQFDLDVDSVDLQNALAATNDLFINAFLEASLIIPEQGTPGGNQDAVLIRESCQIYKTALTI